PTAKSTAGARALMQLMPETAAAVMRVKKLEPEKLFEPELNIRLGTKHLRDLLDQYKGDKVAVIASYNAGAHNVNRWKKIYGGLARDEFVECIPFGETRDYVKKVLAAEAVYRRLYSLK
ncbi:MAG: lytic transglycosylase domain-containing protein, partial [Geobacter sp.]|nr:lytic transglycosylase domain-containing protein [Geobacter sp.]